MTILCLRKQRSDLQMCSDIWRIESSSLGIYLLGNIFSIIPCFTLILLCQLIFLVVSPGRFISARHSLIGHCFSHIWTDAPWHTPPSVLFFSTVLQCCRIRVEIARAFFLFLTPSIHTNWSWLVYNWHAVAMRTRRWSETSLYKMMLSKWQICMVIWFSDRRHC